MKYNIFSALLFIIIAGGLFYLKQNYVADYTFTKKAENFMGYKDTTEIDEVRSAAKELLKSDEYYVNSYNNLVKNSVNVFISLCLLSAFFSVLAIISYIKKGRQSKMPHGNKTPDGDNS